EPARPAAFAPRPIPPLPRSSGADIVPGPAGARPERGARDEAVVAAFDREGLEVHLQPVVVLPQRKVVSYEALARLRVEGEVLAPEAFLPVLERYGRTTDLDRRMLQRVATIARHLAGRGSEAAVAYGLSPLSLYEPGFLRSLARLVAAEPGLAGRIVMALPQASWRNLDAEQAAALAALRGRIGFILDRPTDLRFDALSLAERGVGQVKVPADLLLRQAAGRGPLSDIAVEDLVAALARAGIRLVACAVEHEGDVPDLIDLDVPFAQGSVFAAPRAVRAEVLTAPPAPPPPQPPADDPEPPPQRRPFRDFLRRAS
ncbi:EAL domain-containing protein, partial [Methylobacterium segetis]